jgi:hypothetical protein
MTRPAPIRLDFAVGAHTSRAAGLALLIAGVVAVVMLGSAFNAKIAERNRLDAALEAMPKAHRKAVVTDPKVAAELAVVERELSVPWTPLLNELEVASHDLADTVSVLEISPDPAKHVVKITAEARSLPDALAYLERLQKSPLLRYPMLESHERKKDDPEHPVRVKLSAEWRS